MMKNSVFQDLEINQLVTESWIAVMVDYDNVSEAEWINHFGVKCLPTHLILDKNGNIVARTEGGMSISQFKEFLINKTTNFIQTEQTKINVGFISSNNELVSKNSSNISTTNGQDSYGKIIVDGVLVDIENVSEKNSINIENKINFSNPSSINGQYVIQLGAFNSLEKIKSHQKTISSKTKEQTLIIVDFNTEKSPYKLISKARYSEQEAMQVSKDLLAVGLDCFVRVL
jgi:hypothetical protein